MEFIGIPAYFINPPPLDVPTQEQLLGHPSIKPPEQAKPMIFLKICLNRHTYEPLPILTLGERIKFDGVNSRIKLNPLAIYLLVIIWCHRCRQWKIVFLAGPARVYNFFCTLMTKFYWLLLCHYIQDDSVIVYDQTFAQRNEIETH